MQKWLKIQFYQHIFSCGVLLKHTSGATLTFSGRVRQIARAAPHCQKPAISQTQTKTKQNNNKEISMERASVFLVTILK